MGFRKIMKHQNQFLCSYNSAGLPESITYPGGKNGQAGETVTYSYNHPHAAVQFGNNSYEYDASGNQIAREVDNKSYDLTYDSENRLVQVESDQPFPPQPTATPSPTLTPTFTSTPTPTQATPTPSATATSLYTPSKTPTATKKPRLFPTFVIPPTYTPTGSIYMSIPVTQAVHQQPESQTRALLQEEDLATYTYDGDGKLVMSQVGETITLYPNAYYEVQGTTSKNFYFAGADRIAIRENNELTFLLHDHLGSTVGTVNSAGNLTSQTRYTAFGETRGAATTSTDYLYTGQRAEGEIGLYFYNARWYDPALARFISADTLVPDPGNALAWDRYAYVYNNPICYTDPSGHVICMDGEYCGISGSTGFLKHIYRKAITEVYQWQLKGTFKLADLQTIYQVGYNIQTYVDGLNGNGLGWIRNQLKGATFVNYGMAKDTSYVLPGNNIYLAKNWQSLDQNVALMLITHELGHVWDNNSSLTGLGTYIGGGSADRLYKFLSENQKLSMGIRFINIQPWFKKSRSYLINKLGEENYFMGDYLYGNGATADYFAEAFSLGIYAPSEVPIRAYVWVRVLISLQVSQ